MRDGNESCLWLKRGCRGYLQPGAVMMMMKGGGRGVCDEILAEWGGYASQLQPNLEPGVMKRPEETR
jgi:hypothetical protein